MSDSESDAYGQSMDESDGYEPEVTKAPKSNGKGKQAAKPAATKAAPKAKAPATKKAAVGGAKAKPAAAKNSGTKRKADDMEIDSDNDNDQSGSRAQSRTPDDDDDADDDTAPAKATKSKALPVYNENKTIEEIYQKKTPLEHILLRPDTYIGTTEMNKEMLWVYNSTTKRLEHREVKIVPGLYKIVDEIIVNAADNKIRDPSMDTIKVEIDKERGIISVYNNGKGIPVEIHKAEQCYVPELIFGHLLTSSNYDDSQKKVTGGRNGYGAKLCNIFSTEFVVETADKKSGKQYKQTFSKNMSVTGKPKITDLKKGEEFTKITFKPDFARFHMENIDDDLEALLKKRTFDMAGCVKGVKVFLNGERIKIKNFKEYIDMYLPEGDDKPKLIYDSPDARWEVGCIPSEGQFQQVSFVNSIATSKGGVHVDYVANQIVKELVAAIKKKSKTMNVKPFQIKNQMWIFVNCLIENPAFDSQTKETMTLKQSAFGSKCELSEKFIKEVIKSPVLESVMNVVAAKEMMMLKKTDGKKRDNLADIVKLEDATRAGYSDAHKCTLIITEGDSAKTLVMSAFGVIDRKYYGVFPLRGKLLNVRDSTTTQESQNAEIKNLKRILGLKQNQQYTSVDSLRYGHLMIMTDQDHDGSHIKGLLINFFDHNFPSLLRIPGFLVEFITPIVRATKGKESHSFFTIPEYEQWKEQLPQGTKGWKVKYYKGLGTSGKQDAKDYFSQMRLHKKDFLPLTNEASALVDMAFNKKKADDRKEWLSRFVPGTYLDTTQPTIPIEDFINKELILFSMADNIRSIPSMMDGLKPGQRKVVYGAFKKKIQGEIKVAQLAGFVSEKAAYHHGEVSLQMTIVGLAQDFVGSNNINLLRPNGQFGSRLAGGKDAASARYINTAVPPITRKIFHPHDDALLTYLNDDGDWIEPEWYAPVLPLVLVNGSDGIGTGWSSSIPNYNPMDVITNIRRLMRGESMESMMPWYRGFSGTIEKETEHRYKVSGTFEVEEDNTIHITELPIRIWTTPYKATLAAGMVASETSQAWIKDFKDSSSVSKVDMTVILTPEEMRKTENEGIEKRFKLASSVATSNMVCFDPQGRIKKYASPQDIIQEFFDVRVDLYRKRKEYLLDLLNRQWTRLDCKVRFILMIISGELVVHNRKKADIVEELHLHNFTIVTDLDLERTGNEAPNDPNADPNLDLSKIKVEKGTEYDYLLKLPIWSLTREKVEELKKEREAKKIELTILIDKSIYDLWNEDLDAFQAEWEAVLQQDIEDEANMGVGNKAGGSKAAKSRGRVLGGGAVRGAGSTSKVKKEDDDDFEMSKPKKPTTAAAPRKPTVKKEDVDMKLNDESSVGVNKDAPKKQQSIKDLMQMKPAAKVKKEESTSPPVMADIDDDDSMVVAKPVKKSSGYGKSRKVLSDTEEDEEDVANDSESDFERPSKGKKKGDKKDDDDDVQMDIDEDLPVRERAPRAARARKPAIVDYVDSDFDDEEVKPSSSSSSSVARKGDGESDVVEQPATAIDADDDDEMTPPPPPAKTAKKPTAPASQPKKKRRIMESESESDFESGSNSNASATKKAGRSKNASNDDNEDDFEGDSTGKKDDDDGSDFDDLMAKKLATKAKKAAAPAKGKTATTAAAKATKAPSKAQSTTKKMFSLSVEDNVQDASEENDAADKVIDSVDSPMMEEIAEHTAALEVNEKEDEDEEMVDVKPEPVEAPAPKKKAAPAPVPVLPVTETPMDDYDFSMFDMPTAVKVQPLKKKPSTIQSRLNLGGSSSSGNAKSSGAAAAAATAAESVGSSISKLKSSSSTTFESKRPSRPQSKKPAYVEIDDD